MLWGDEERRRAWTGRRAAQLARAGVTHVGSVSSITLVRSSLQHLFPVSLRRPSSSSFQFALHCAVTAPVESALSCCSCLCGVSARRLVVHERRTRDGFVSSNVRTPCSVGGLVRRAVRCGARPRSSRGVLAPAMASDALTNRRCTLERERDLARAAARPLEVPSLAAGASVDRRCLPHLSSVALESWLGVSAWF